MNSIYLLPDSYIPYLLAKQKKTISNRVTDLDMAFDYSDDVIQHPL
ncbi:hypothetical protein [Hoylesella timonensis]|nr:hypothetical protein [Hoylesella timonensis]